MHNITHELTETLIVIKFHNNIFSYRWLNLKEINEIN